MKPPFTTKSGLSGTWIEGADGVTVADINPLIDPEIAYDLAELLADGANLLIERRQHQRTMTEKAAKSPNTGRPRHKKPSPAALAKRRSREKARKEAE